jgi:hypothetical protein
MYTTTFFTAMATAILVKKPLAEQEGARAVSGENPGENCGSKACDSTIQRRLGWQSALSDRQNNPNNNELCMRKCDTLEFLSAYGRYK